MKAFQPYKPDFRYPKDVISHAKQQLEESLKEGDTDKTMQALICYSLAETAIDDDAFPKVVAHIDSVSSGLISPDARALSQLLLADIYSGYYSRNFWSIANRTPAEGETDFRLWAQPQFAGKIEQLCAESLSDPQALLASPLEDYPLSVETEATTLQYYPTLYDFACSKAIENLLAISDVPRMLGKGAIEAIPAQSSLPKFLPEPYREAWGIAAQWAAMPRSEAPAAALNALLRQLDLVQQAVVDSSATFNSEMLKIYRKAPAYIAGLVLCYVDFESMDGAMLSDYYRLLGEYPKTGAFAATAAYQRNKISMKSVFLRYPSQVMKGMEFDIEVNVSNLNSTKIVIYRSKKTASHNPSARFKANDLEKVAEIPVKIDGTVPFTGKTIVKATIDQYGEYVILSDKTPREGFNDIVRCSDLAIASAATSEDYLFWTVDALTGHPVRDAKVTASFYHHSRTGTTDGDGFVELQSDNNSCKAYPELGEDIYAPFGSVCRRNEYIPGPTAWIRTSRPIYHPGDSLDFVLIAYRPEQAGRTGVMPGLTVQVTLYNANNEKTEEMKVVTDDYGRASGCFQLPETGLTGNYRIAARSDAPERNVSGSLSVMVSDYKLPTYEVVMEKPSLDSRGNVTVRGRAVTYSGFPVQNAEVTLTLRNGERYLWWRSPGRDVTVSEETTETDADGRFSMEFSELRSILPYPDGVMNVAATVTSQAKETHEAYTSFALSEGLSIQFTPGEYLQAGPAAKLPVMVADGLGNPVAAKADIEFRSGEVRIVRSLDIVPGIPAVADLSGLPTGPCSVTITSAGADSLQLDDVAVYNPAIDGCPDGMPLWVKPETIVVEAAKRKAAVTYATAEDDCRVLMLLSTGNSIAERKWLSPVKGLNELEIDLPADVTEAQLTLYCVRQAKSYERNVSIKVQNPDETLRLTVACMRDRAVPGTPETLALRVGNGNGEGVPAAMVLDVYCKALDVLATQNWHLQAFRSPSTVTFESGLRGLFSQRWSNNSPMYVNQMPACPVFRLYNLQFGESMLRYNSVKMCVRGDAEEDAVCDAAAPLADSVMVGAPNKDMDNGYVKEDDAAADEPAGNEAVDTTGDQKPEYRPSEVALAFFAPNLTTEEDGTLTVTFPLPNANTTWLTKALAFTKGLAVGLDISEIVAAKPLMVQPNLPRFLRTGDKADIRVTVMNASEKECSANVRFEVLDGVSGECLVLSDTTMILAAGASRTPVFGIEAPLGCNALEVRVSASDGTYTDAERCILPVMPSSQPVTDSDVFYLAADEKDWCRDLEAVDEDAVTVISFCENPTWEVVSALPGLMANTSGTSIGESARIYSAAVSGYVLSLNPDIESHLAEWLETTPQEMRSSLSRNPELRQMLLSATPWVGAEASDSERINRLWLIFDKENVADYMSGAIAALRRLQTPEGGWLWCPDDNTASLWMTFQVLNNFADLRKLGCFPEELAEDCARALEWVDMKVDETRRDIPDYTDLQYAYVRSMYREIPNCHPGVYDNTVRYAAKHWDAYPPAGQAAAAMLLHAEGRDGAARAILESLRQYAKSSPQEGMWWPNLEDSSWWALLRTGQTALILDAFRTIEPGCAEIDPIRQWLILSKTTTDWKTSVDAAACVASILRCGSNWLSKPGSTKITAGGKPEALNDVDVLTGRIVVRIDAPQGRVCIARENDGPAWGAVMTTATRVMETVEAHSAADQLSIEKQILAADAGGKWLPLETSGTTAIQAGAKVKVRLVIEAARDFDYLSITDARAAGLETVVQTPRRQWSEGIGFYFEPRDTDTNIFVSRLPKGVYVLEYDAYANNSGIFASGVATIRSQYAPEYTAHSAGMRLVIE